MTWQHEFQRAEYAQQPDTGYQLKDREAFVKGEGVCYIPENTDTEYTRETFLQLVGGSEQRAAILFDACTWQHPETLLDEEEHDHVLFGEPGDEWYVAPGEQTQVDEHGNNRCTTWEEEGSV